MANKKKSKLQIKRDERATTRKVIAQHFNEREMLRKELQSEINKELMSEIRKQKVVIAMNAHQEFLSLPSEANKRKLLESIESAKTSLNPKAQGLLDKMVAAYEVHYKDKTPTKELARRERYAAKENFGTAIFNLVAKYPQEIKRPELIKLINNSTKQARLHIARPNSKYREAAYKKSQDELIRYLEVKSVAKDSINILKSGLNSFHNSIKVEQRAKKLKQQYVVYSKIQPANIKRAQATELRQANAVKNMKSPPARYVKPVSQVQVAKPVPAARKSVGAAPGTLFAHVQQPVRSAPRDVVNVQRIPQKNVPVNRKVPVPAKRPVAVTMSPPERSRPRSETILAPNVPAPESPVSRQAPQSPVAQAAPVAPVRKSLSVEISSEGVARLMNDANQAKELARKDHETSKKSSGAEKVSALGSAVEHRKEYIKKLTQAEDINNQLAAQNPDDEAVKDTAKQLVKYISHARNQLATLISIQLQAEKDVHPAPRM